MVITRFIENYQLGGCLTFLEKSLCLCLTNRLNRFLEKCKNNSN